MPATSRLTMLGSVNCVAVTEIVRSLASQTTSLPIVNKLLVGTAGSIRNHTADAIMSTVCQQLTAGPYIFMLLWN